MGGAPKETKTVVEPWSGAKGPLLEVYKQYGQALAAGKPQYYQGSTIAEQSQATKDAQAQALAAAGAANANGYLGNAAAVTNNITNSGGSNAQAMDTLSKLQGGVNVGSNPTNGALAGLLGSLAGGNAPGTSTYNALQTGTNPGVGAAGAVYGAAANGNNPGSSNLAAMASGAERGNNPYLNQSVANATQSIADQLGKVQLPGLQSQAAALGRGGSNAFASQVNDANTTAANAMSKVATDMYANQWNTDTQNMLGANNQVSNNYNSDFQNKLNASTNLGNSYAQNANTQLAAAGANDQNYQNKFANLLSGLGQMSNNHNNDVSNQLANAGLQQSAANSANAASAQTAQTQLAAAGQAGNAYNNTLLPAETIGAVGGQQDTRAQDALNALIAEWDFNQQMPLQQLANYSNILNGGNYQTQSSQTTGGRNGLSQALGGLSSIAGLFTALSDRRMKENIKYLGEAPSGHKIYEYNYIGEDRKFVGPMAQDIKETDPDCVIEHNDNLFITHNVFDRMAG